MQGARRISALSGYYAHEVVDKRTPKTSRRSETEEEDRGGSLLSLFTHGRNTITSSESWRKRRENEFVPFNWETKHTQQYAVQSWQARVRQS